MSIESWRAVCDTCHEVVADWPNGTMVEAAGKLHLQNNFERCESVTVGYSISRNQVPIPYSISEKGRDLLKGKKS